MNNDLHRQITKNFTNLINDLIPKNSNIPSDENINLASLISLFLNPSKEVNPHTIVRKLSDKLIEHIVQHRNEIPDNNMMKMILQLFIIEWIYRNDFMHQDWVWEWNTDGKSGEAKIDAKLPLDQIPLPRIA